VRSHGTTANHESPRTTKLYDRSNDTLTLDEIERITLMMGRELVPFPSLLVQPKPPPLALRVVVLDSHVAHGPHPPKRVDHGGHHGAITQTD
jgi:hypothetical protein